jgi:ribosomal-protein-alanine N-acetyltransferase
MSNAAASDNSQGIAPDLIPLGCHHIELLAALHQDAFEDPWPEESFADLLKHPGTYGWVVCDKIPLGFILCRSVAGEAEILTLAVAQANRHLGVGTRLVDAMIDKEIAEKSTVIHLEVAADNPAARALYKKAGFHISGNRKGYYAKNGGAVDAILMSKALKKLKI